MKSLNFLPSEHSEHLSASLLSTSYLSNLDMMYYVSRFSIKDCYVGLWHLKNSKPYNFWLQIKSLCLYFLASKPFDIYFLMLAECQPALEICCSVCLSILVLELWLWGPSNLNSIFSYSSSVGLKAFSILVCLSLAETIISNSKDLWHIFLKTQV